MGLRDLIDDVRRREKTLVVHAPESEADVVAELRARLDVQNVGVERVDDDGTGLRAELTRDGVVLASAGADAVRALAGVGPDAEGADEVLDYLDETTFTSYDTRQMLQATREIEDRAWRVGRGALHSGFQCVSAFTDQEEAYRRLGSSELSVHVYGAPDDDPPSGPFEVHLTDDPDVTRTWFVVFDGGGTETQKSALLAEERAADRYFGFWTYDPGTVDDVLAELPADAPRA